MKFDNLVIYLLEQSRHTRNLVPNSEMARKKRAQNVKLLSLDKSTPSTSPKDKPLLKGWKLWEYEALSEEQREGRRHNGYLVLDKNNNIKDVFCSCADFQFLWRYAFNKGDMASWETYPDYKNIETHAPHTEEPSHITNPKFEKKLCKHLIKAFDTVDV